MILLGRKKKIIILDIFVILLKNYNIIFLITNLFCNISNKVRKKE